MAARRYEFHFPVVILILFLTQENKIHIFKPPNNFNFPFIIWTNLSLAIFHQLFAQTTVKYTTRVLDVVYMNFMSGVFSSKTLLSIL